MKPNFEPGKWFMQCVGIDIAKKTFTACLCMYEFDQGCSTAPVVFNNDKTGFNQFVKWSRKEALKGYPLRYLMEPTGVYYEPLAYHLNKLGLNVCVVLPNKAREFAKYEGILTKTDDMDAYTLGMLGCVDKRLKPWTPPSPIYRELRQMTRFVADINKVRTELQNHLESLTHSEIAEKSIVKHYNKLIDEIDKQLASNQKAIHEKIKQEPGLAERIERIVTIKGLGFMTVVNILAETNGFALITNRRQLTSYAGLDVPAHQSGPVDAKRHISKQGNVHLRTALFYPAIVSTKYNPQMKDFYGRLCAKKTQSKMIGVTATMRKLLLLVYSLWKSGEVYDPTRDKPVCSKKKKEAETSEGQPHGIDVGTLAEE
jgi:transposase